MNTEVFCYVTVKPLLFFFTTVTMDRKYFICLWLVVLLISPASILADNYGKVKETKNKRQAQALLPLASYAGLVVAPELYLALAAAYGLSALIKYGITKGTVSYHFIFFVV